MASQAATSTAVPAGESSSGTSHSGDSGRPSVSHCWIAASKPEVVAFSTECPHLGCAVGLAGDGKSFLCPCHNSNFKFSGERRNHIPPRDMDSLELKLSADPDPEVRVKFQQFRTATEEKKPLV